MLAVAFYTNSSMNPFTFNFYWHVLHLKMGLVNVRKVYDGITKGSFSLFSSVLSNLSPTENISE